ncbi:MAG: hypothetical protein VR67_03305 [Peptococcaceae bacterium BRH_c8a]|nr:MAG: hypothetical protein VR67_03305 [Peptococcaceae bacterium BRH_c8a]
MLHVDELKRLSSYYKDIISAMSQQSGKHFVDLGQTLRYGLTLDLGLFIDDVKSLMYSDRLILKIERMSPKAVSDILTKSDDQEEDTEEQKEEQEEIKVVDPERKTASARLVAIYRKQEQDRFNRETTIGFPIIAGKHGSTKFCGPLFYFTVQVDYEPLESKIIFSKNFVTPVFNSKLIAKLVNGDSEMELVRQKVLPLLYEEDFNEKTINKVIKIIAEVVEALAGLEIDPVLNSPLQKAIDARDNGTPTVYRAISIVNSSRGNAFLLDELSQLANLEEIDGETVIETILKPVPESMENDGFSDNPDSTIHSRPLLFPLLSNQAQRRAARKAEKSRLMVIQGPPGTGKSQTIANLVCDLVAEGNSVLIASHQNKALEVVAEKLPDIDYLSMSLLKGEKASAAQLANKLATFDTYVADVSTVSLNNSFEKNMEAIHEKDQGKRKLQARFSELKTIERDKFSDYYKFHELREYNHISLDDEIPEGLANEIPEALKQWCSHFKNISTNYSDLLHIFVPSKLQSIDILYNYAKATKKIVDYYNIDFYVSEGNDSRDLIKNFYENAKTNLNESFDYLKSLREWLEKNGEKYLVYITKLDELSIPLPNFVTAKQALTTMSSDVLTILNSRAQNLYDKYLKLVESGIPPSILKESPSLEEINITSKAIEILYNRSWFVWHTNPNCISSRKQLSQMGLKIIHNTKEQTLSDLKTWNKYWSLKYEVIGDIKSLKGAGIPVSEMTVDSSISQISHQVMVAVSYLDLLRLVDIAPKEKAPEKLTMSAYETLNKLSDSESLVYIKSRIDKTIIHLQTIIGLNNINKEIQGNEKLLGTLNEVIETVVTLNYEIKVQETVDNLKLMLSLHPDFAKAIELESGILQTLPKTLETIKTALINNIRLTWLKDINKAIEAHRLGKFIQTDLASNPDNIDEVAMRISKISEEKRNLVIKAIKLRRKISLKYASIDMSTRQQVTKLNKLLSKKRKTVSLVQLKGQVSYTKLLTVFPCWIMSIDDVARVFPLQAGLFDYLIVDEASQCNQATALHLAFRAKRMIVVGDEKQMKNPNVRFLSDNLVQVLLSRHGLGTHHKAEFLHGRESLLSLSNFSANSNEFLNEHFRCEPPIIAWSNKEFYDNKLRVLTPIRRKRFMPCLEVQLVKGADDNTETKQNLVEAETVVNEVIRLITSGEADGLTIGVMSLYRQQATLLQNLIYEKLEERPDWIKKYQLIVSTADGFQGDERDIILYSMRFGPSSSPGVINAIQIEPERINVAFSRARRKMIYFISRPVEEFPRGILKDFLLHAENEHRNPTDRLGMVGEDKFDSDFEKDVCFALRDGGYTVFTQVPCSNFKIDMVVIDDEGRRIAVECDGDFHYEDDGDLRAEDYQRQDIIERSGWFVHRVPARRYYANPEAAIALLIGDLKRQPTDQQITDSEIEGEFFEEEFSPLDVESLTTTETADVNPSQTEAQSTKEVNIKTLTKEKLNKKKKQITTKPKTKEAKQQLELVFTTENKPIQMELDFTADSEPLWDKNVWYALSRWGKVSGKFSGYNNSFCYKIGLYLAQGYNLTEKQEFYAKRFGNQR